MSAANEKQTDAGSKERTVKPLLILTALGIVFGDIGTSPLYAFKAGMDAAGGITPENIMVLFP